MDLPGPSLPDLHDVISLVIAEGVAIAYPSVYFMSLACAGTFARV